MKRILFLFAFLFALVATEAKVVPIDNDVGSPITMELNATIDVAVTQSINFLFAETQHIDKVFKKEYTLFEFDVSTNKDAKFINGDIFTKTYQRGNLTKDQNSNYLKSYLRLNIKGLIEIALLDQNNTYYKSYLRLFSHA